MPHFIDSLPMLLGAGMGAGLHCAGMCGGLALLATGAEKRSRVLSLALYLAGKSWSYAVLGALGGAVGGRIAQWAPLGFGTRALALVSGLLLLSLGLRLLGLPGGRISSPPWLGTVSGSLVGLAHRGGAGGQLLLGATNGFLPCPLVYAFLGMAAAAGSALQGASSMLVLGLTSSLPLALCAIGGYRLTTLAGRRLPQAGGALLVAMALLTLYRGLVNAGLHHAVRH